MFDRVLNMSLITPCIFYTAWNVSKYEVFSGPYFPVFGLNTEICGVNLRIQFEYRKIRTRKNSVFGHVSRSVNELKWVRHVIVINYNLQKGCEIEIYRFEFQNKDFEFVVVQQWEIQI